MKNVATLFYNSRSSYNQNNTIFTSAFNNSVFLIVQVWCECCFLDRHFEVSQTSVNEIDRN